MTFNLKSNLKTFKTSDIVMETKQQALCLLLSKDHKDSSNFESILEENINNVHEFLHLDITSIKDLIPDLYYSRTSCNNVQWKYVSLCFYILYLPEENNDLQSVTHMSNIRTAFQFIVSLGLIPNLIPGVGLDIKLRFKNINLIPTENIEIKDRYYRLRSVTKLLLQCFQLDSLKCYLVENQLGDILSACLQITSAPLKKPGSSNDNFNMSEEFYLELLQDRKYFQMKLHDLLVSTHQPLIFRELMFLNGNKKSPMWLKNCILQILMERIQMKNGVESLIKALFDSESPDIGLNWKHWDILTKLLMTKPNYINEKDYYTNICGQLTKLLNKRTFDGDRILIYEQTIILCTKFLYEINENTCNKHFITPLIQMLLNLTNKTKIAVRNITHEVEQIIFILYSLLMDCKCNEKPISIIVIKPILVILYNLYYITLNTKKIKLNDEIAHILTKYLTSCEYDHKKKLYDFFLFDTNLNDVMPFPKDITLHIEKENILIQLQQSDFIDIFSRSDSCVHLLEKNEIITSTFFKYLLEIFLNTFQENSELSIDNAERKIIIYQLLLKLLENKIVLKNLNTNPSELLIFSENFLKLIYGQNVHKSTDYDSQNYQTLFVLIMIVNNIIKNCENENINDHTILLNILRKISIETSNNELKLLINEINNINEDEKCKTDYDKAIDEICSPLIPEQAHGLATIVKLIEQRDPETYRRRQYVLNIFQQNLKSEESFIYLRAIAGLAALADAFPNTILETLTDEYLYPKGTTDNDNEVRMKIGEVLLRITANLGEGTVKYKALLLNTFLGAAKDLDPLIRASSLSNLGEVCKVLGFKLGSTVTEILCCIHDVISYDLAVEVRRAAVSVIRQLFIGLGKEMIALLKDDILPVYKTLKTIYKDDPDSVTRLQAQLALEELNEIMRSLVAPETNLENNFVIS